MLAPAPWLQRNTYLFKLMPNAPSSTRAGQRYTWVQKIPTHLGDHTCVVDSSHGHCIDMHMNLYTSIWLQKSKTMVFTVFHCCYIGNNKLNQQQKTHQLEQQHFGLLHAATPARRSQLWKYEPSNFSMRSRVMPSNSFACANSFTKFRSLVPPG